jgi:hypothetical protein
MIDVVGLVAPPRRWASVPQLTGTPLTWVGEPACSGPVRLAEQRRLAGSSPSASRSSAISCVLADGRCRGSRSGRGMTMRDRVARLLQRDVVGSHRRSCRWPRRRLDAGRRRVWVVLAGAVSVLAGARHGRKCRRTDISGTGRLADPDEGSARLTITHSVACARSTPGRLNHVKVEASPSASRCLGGPVV